MEERHADQDGVPGFDQGPGRARAAEAGRIVGLGQLHALGQAGRPGGVELNDVIVLADRAMGVGGGMGTDPVPEAWPAHMPRLELDPHLQVSKVTGQTLDHASVVGSDDREATTGVLEDEGDLRRRQAPVDRIEAGTCLQAPEPKDEKVGIASGEGPDPVPRLHACSDERLGALRGQGVKPGVGDLLVLEDQGDSVRPHTGMMPDHICGTCEFRKNNAVRFRHGMRSGLMRGKDNRPGAQPRGGVSLTRRPGARSPGRPWSRGTRGSRSRPTRARCRSSCSRRRGPSCRRHHR